MTYSRTPLSLRSGLPLSSADASTRKVLYWSYSASAGFTHLTMALTGEVDQLSPRQTPCVPRSVTIGLVLSPTHNHLSGLAGYWGYQIPMSDRRCLVFMQRRVRPPRLHLLSSAFSYLHCIINLPVLSSFDFRASLNRGFPARIC